MNHKSWALAVISGLLVLAGCSPQEAAPPPHAVAQQIQQIQDNPHMPDAAKQRAIQMIRSATSARSETATEAAH